MCFVPYRCACDWAFPGCSETGQMATVLEKGDFCRPHSWSASSLLPEGLLSIIATELLAALGWGRGQRAHTWMFFPDLRRFLSRHPSHYCKHLVNFQSPVKVDLTSCALSCFLLWKSGLTKVLTLPLLWTFKLEPRCLCGN